VIPKHISEFLRTAIRSTWALDSLRLIKLAPARTWTSAALTAELRGSVPMVEGILAGFARWGLVLEDPPGFYRYAANAELDATVSELLRLYAERPVAVIGEIALSPNDKIQTFVDAFRMKKD
jgi:hypothetical protein